MSSRLEPPRRLSEVKTWLASNADRPGAYSALEWRAGRTFATHDACLRALTSLGTPEALDSLATYRGKEAGNLEDLGDSWERFDRAAFARRVLSNPVTLSSKRGVSRLEGIEHVEALRTLTVDLAGGCSLEPLARCTELLSLQLFCRGDLELSPLTALAKLDRCVLQQSELITRLKALAGSQMRKLSLRIGAEQSWAFLLDLPRLEHAQLTCANAALSTADRAVVAALFQRGVTVHGYTHEPWTAALRELAGPLRYAEKAGFIASGGTTTQRLQPGGLP